LERLPRGSPRCPGGRAVHLSSQPAHPPASLVSAGYARSGPGDLAGCWCCGVFRPCRFAPSGRSGEHYCWQRKRRGDELSWATSAAAVGCRQSPGAGTSGNHRWLL